MSNNSRLDQIRCVMQRDSRHGETNPGNETGSLGLNLVQEDLKNKRTPV